MNAGEKRVLSQPLAAGAALRDVTGRSDSNMPDNFLSFLSDATPPTPPDVAIRSCATNRVAQIQRTIRYGGLLLAGHIINFLLLY
jgi:hypothetical protein